LFKVNYDHNYQSKYCWWVFYL